MRQRIAFILRILAGASLVLAATHAQAETMSWGRQFGTISDDGALAVSADPLGNVFVSGSTEGVLTNSNSGLSDAFVRMYTASGTLVWTQQFGGAKYDWASALSADGLGHVYAAGRIQGPNSPYTGATAVAFLNKYDSAGNLLWSQKPDGTFDAESVSADKSGSIYVAGIAGSQLTNSNSRGMAFLAKYDENGANVWNRQFGTGTNWINGVFSDGVNGIYVAGYTSNDLDGVNAGALDAFVRKYDASGNVIWTRQFGTTASDAANGVSGDSSGNIYVVSTLGQGGMPENNTGDGDVILNKFDGAGNLAWSRTYDSGATDLSNGVSVDGLGNVYITGATWGSIAGTNAGHSDAFEIKIDANGNTIWSRQFGTDLWDNSISVSADGLGNVYTAGNTEGQLFGALDGFEDAFMLKISDPVPEPSALLLLCTAIFIGTKPLRKRRS
jgi:hypothetical protein